MRGQDTIKPFLPAFADGVSGYLEKVPERFTNEIDF